MVTKLSATEAKRQLSIILREIEKRPERRYLITVRDRVVAEVRAVSSAKRGGETGEQLLNTAMQLEQRDIPVHATARNHDDYLYTQER